MQTTRQLIYKIADNIKKSHQEVQPYIQILQKNWYNTQDSLQNLTINDYQKYGIPRRLAEIIIEQSTKKQQPQFQHYPTLQTYQQQQQPHKQPSFQPQQPAYKQQTNQQQPIYHQQQQGYQQQQPNYQQQQQMYSKQQKQIPSYNNNTKQQSPVRKAIQHLQAKCSKQKFNQFIDTLTRLFRNIRNNISDQKYRTLKKSNKKIAQLISYSSNSQILKYGGFQQNKDLITLKNFNLGTIDDIIQILNQFDETIKFDPYKSQITHLVNNTPNTQGQSTTIFNDKLKQLQQQRKRIMSKPIKDRQIKIYKQIIQQQIKADKTWMQNNDDVISKQDQKIINQSLKQKLKNFGDPQFMSKRKIQFFQLSKKPCYSQTLIKVKLPDHLIFECKFSPLQTLQQLVKIFHEVIIPLYSTYKTKICHIIYS